MRYRTREERIVSYVIGTRPNVIAEIVVKYHVTVTDDHGIPVLEQEWDHDPSPGEISGRLLEGTLPLDDGSVKLSDVAEAIETLRADVRGGRL